MLTVFGALAELEREQIRQRQAEWIAIAKKEGKYQGRQPICYDEMEFEHLYKLWKSGEITQKYMCKNLKMSRSTLSRRINEYKEKTEKRIIYLDGFKKVDNSLKAEFPGYFEYMWGNYRNSFDISGENIIKTEKSLQSLSDLLKELSEQYTDAVFKRKATDMFIRVVESIISRNSSHKEEMQIDEDVD